MDGVITMRQYLVKCFFKMQSFRFWFFGGQLGTLFSCKERGTSQFKKRNKLNFEFSKDVSLFRKRTPEKNEKKIILKIILRVFF